MIPSSGSHSYGSVDEASKSCRVSHGDEARAGKLSSEDCQISSSLAPPITVKARMTRRWPMLAVVCGLALAASAAFVRISTRAPDGVQDTLLAGAANSASYSNFAAVPPSSDERVVTLVTPQQPQRQQHEAPNPLTERATPGEKSVPLEFTALNFYHIRDGKPGQDYPWLRNMKLVEPHRETTLTVVNPTDGLDYRWSVHGGDNPADVLISDSGVEVVALFTLLDENVIRLEEVDSDGIVIRSLEETVMVKYVRREIRSLTDEDRVELLDSMAKLWHVRVQGGLGKELYGPDYADIWAINRLHYKAASPPMCDHFHDGLGFLTSHSLISNTFEFSLQLVNPKLTLPYWDFTIESSTAGGAGPDTPEPQGQSPLLSSSWFGTHDPVDQQVKDSRWAFTEIPPMKMNNPGGISPDVYSKLRSPWNVNNRAYLSRGLGSICGFRVEDYYPWPTCEMHYELATEYSDFASWVWNSLYDPHGPVHVWLGGVLDCEETYREIGHLVGQEIAKDLAYISFYHRKNLFRDGIFKCEGNADVKSAPEEVFSRGMCGCLDYDLTQGDDYLVLMSKIAFLPEYLADFSEDIKRKVVSKLCTGVTNDGDHLQSSSSLDPSFWASHPTMERLWMFSLLTGTITDLEWPDKDTEVVASDGTSYVIAVSLYSDKCVGHRGSDVFPFGILKHDTADFNVRTGIKGNPMQGNIFTNREILEAFDPRQNKLNYIYDNFEWVHCAADGFDLRDIIKAPHSPELMTNGVMPGLEVEESDQGVQRARTRERAMFKKDGPRHPLYSHLKDVDKKHAGMQNS